MNRLDQVFVQCSNATNSFRLREKLRHDHIYAEFALSQSHNKNCNTSKKTVLPYNILYTPGSEFF